jgi:hypothetical protein
MTTAKERAAEVAKANEIVMTLLEALPEGGHYEWEQWMVAARAVLNRRAQFDAKAAQRLQLVVAGQWLGHAADRLRNHFGNPLPSAELSTVLHYLTDLGEWLASETPGDEPRPS